MAEDQKHRYKIAIIGAGFSGLCMGIMLKQAGYDDFIILEKANALGGTWLANTYPGAECDVPSALYSYSFEHNSRWEYKWSGQAQILKYQEDTARKYGVDQHIRFSTELSAASYDETEHCWSISTLSGDRYTSQHLISGVGQLHHPSIPAIKNADQFKGSSFHTAEWDHEVELTDKQVAVIGNAATAVQFIPKIAPLVKNMTVYQRSANWVLPKLDRPYTRFEQWFSEKFPPINKVYRLGLWLRGEWGILPAIRGNRFAQYVLRKWNQWLMKKSIKDFDLLKKLTPDYPVGAKRILLADDYYQTLARDNVELKTNGIKEFTRNGIIDVEGKEQACDVAIYSTGFKTNPFLAPMVIRGQNSIELSEHWAGGAHAYLGVSTAGFPNFHILYGPNTNLGHNSIIIMIEAQSKYIIECIKSLDCRDLKALEVKSEVEDKYNAEIQYRLDSLAFSDIAESWYKDRGRITNNWPGGTREYMKLLRRVNWDAYEAHA